jgi:demethylmenaquinone methyltransferase / 2-methoxy-6-polyprenyl-1,4-benzoquinol methylase
VTDAPGEDPVRAHFRRDAEYWRSIYEDDADRAGAAYHERLERVLAGVDALGLTPPVHAVDVGAGAGLASVALAERGYDVLAVDSTRRMLELTEARAAAAGLVVHLAEADASSLPRDNASVDLVVAVGLIPWLVDPRPVLDEFRRVLRPRGGLVITADNRWRLTELADPSLSPLLAPVRRYVVHPLKRRRGWSAAPFEPRRHSRMALEQLLTDAGFTVLESSTVGYGPVSIMRRPLPAALAGAVERRASRHAAMPVLRSIGVHVVATATRGEQSKLQDT